LRKLRLGVYGIDLASTKIAYFVSKMRNRKEKVCVQIADSKLKVQGRLKANTNILSGKRTF
jgi:hypothetical protein